MEYATLRNGVKMPMLGYGVFQIPAEDTKRCVLEAISVGYRSIDTAQGYFNEEGVGAAIADCGVPRDRLFLTTKIWISNGGYEKAKASIDAALKKLRTDYVDLVLIHQPFNDYYGTYRAMEEAYKAGKIRAIGVSNFMPEHIKPLLDACGIVPHVNQISFYAGHIQRACCAYCEQHGIFVESYAPLATGAVFAQPLVHTLAEKNGVTPAQLCIRYCLQKGHATISKSVHRERLAENAALSFTIPQEDMQALDALDPEP